MKNLYRALLVTCLLTLSFNVAYAQNSLLPDLERVRATYTAPMSPELQAQMLNTVVLLHASEGWGLLAKPSGNNCPLPDGVKIACDILVYRPTGVIFDVVRDAGGDEAVLWPGSQPLDDPSRFVAPVGTAPTPLPNPTPVPGVDLGPLTARVDALQSALAGLTQELAAQRDALNNFNGTLTNVYDRVGLLEHRMIPVSCYASVFGFPISCVLQ